MKISIITTCFNAEEFFTETIESIICQKGNFDLEYIIIDANSNDKTREIAEQYVNKHKNNNLNINCNSLEIKYIRDADNSMYEGLSKGFKLATGDIIAYLNADDLYAPNAFGTVCEIFAEHKNINWITGLNTVCNRRGVITSVSLPASVNTKLVPTGFYGNLFGFIQQESTFWRKHLLQELDYEAFSAYQLAGDFYLWKTFAQKHDLYKVKAVLASFRGHKNQLSSNKTRYIKEFNNIKNQPKPIDYVLAAATCVKTLITGISSMIGIKLPQQNIVYFDYEKTEKWLKTT